MPGLKRGESRRELADFVRERRSRLRPQDVGLHPGERRRTPGLRREEVAQLCGVSVTWYTWFEQGRDIHVSAGFVSRVAEALRLESAEREILCDLAGVREPRSKAQDPATVAPRRPPKARARLSDLALVPVPVTPDPESYRIGQAIKHVLASTVDHPPVAPPAQSAAMSRGGVRLGIRVALTGILMLIPYEGRHEIRQA